MINAAIAKSAEIFGASYSIADLDLVDSPPEAAFDALTRLAGRMFRAPVSLVSIIDESRNRQFFKSLQGLPEPWAGRRETPLTHSFCQHVKAQDRPLIVPSSRNHPLVRDNLAIRDLNVASYLGVPIYGPDRKALGALCVIDGKERDWSPEDVATLSDLAICVTDEITLRAALLNNTRLNRQLRDTNDRISRYTNLRESVVMAFMTPDMAMDDRLQALLQAGCIGLNATQGAIARINGPEAQIICSAFTDPAPDRRRPVDGSLCAIATMGEAIRCHHKVPASEFFGRHDLFGQLPGSFAAVPIMDNGKLFGVLELSGPERPEPWDQEELSVLSIVALLAAAHLSMHGQIAALKRSETALLDQLLQSKRQQRLAS
jgi:GAF domain-containing protein